MTLSAPPHCFRQYAPLLGLLFLAWLSFCVLQYFVITLLWAFIIGYILYPLYEKLVAYFHGNAVLSAAILTGALTAVVICVCYSLLHVLEDELGNTYTQLMATLGAHSFQLPPRIRHIPYLGDYLENRLHYLLTNRVALNEHLVAWAKYSLQIFSKGLRHAGQLIIELCFVLMTVFFCFRDGKTWLNQIQTAMSYFFNDEQGIYLQTLGQTARAVCYGLVLALSLIHI